MTWDTTKSIVSSNEFEFNVTNQGTTNARLELSPKVEGLNSELDNRDFLLNLLSTYEQQIKQVMEEDKPRTFSVKLDSSRVDNLTGETIVTYAVRFRLKTDVTKLQLSSE